MMKGAVLVLIFLLAGCTTGQSPVPRADPNLASSFKNSPLMLVRALVDFYDKLARWPANAAELRDQTGFDPADYTNLHFEPQSDGAVTVCFDHYEAAGSAIGTTRLSITMSNGRATTLPDTR